MNTKIEVSDVLNIRNKIISHPKVITPEKEEDKNEHRQVSPQPPKVSSKLLYKKKGKTDAKVNQNLKIKVESFEQRKKKLNSPREDP